MTNYIVTDDELTDVADSIRTKGGTSALLEWPQGYIDAVDAIETGGGGDPYPVVGDGKTYLHIQVADILRPTVSIRFTQTVSQGVTVDWGDGSATETYTGTSAATHTHTYAAAGEYTIVLDVTSGYIRYGGSSANALFVTGSTTNGAGVNRARLLAAEVGTHGATADTIGTYMFYYCYALQSVTIPSGVTSIGGSAFSGCYSLQSVTIPSGVTSIGANAFQNCYSLPSAIIPSGITSIEARTFNNCYSVKEYHVLPATPPTLSNTNAFSGIPSDCIIYVPSGSLNAYKTATNWSTHASKMQGE